jgi:hypothetical protein
MAEKSDVIIPITRVVAKPLMGPELKSRMIPTINVVKLESIMAERAFL